MRQGRNSFLFLIFFFLSFFEEVHGAIYKWVDGNGNIFFADSKSKVPEQYRGHVREVNPRRGSLAREGSGLSGGNLPLQKPSVPPPSRSPVPPIFEQKTDAQGREKRWWRNLANQWETKKKNAEERIEALKLEQRQLQFHEMMPEKKRSKENLRIQKLIQAAIMRRDVAIRMLIEGLPNEAKKAGAPIEWLTPHKE